MARAEEPLGKQKPILEGNVKGLLLLWHLGTFPLWSEPHTPSLPLARSQGLLSPSQTLRSQRLILLSVEIKVFVLSAKPCLLCITLLCFPASHPFQLLPFLNCSRPQFIILKKRFKNLRFYIIIVLL